VDVGSVGAKANAGRASVRERAAIARDERRWRGRQNRVDLVAVAAVKLCGGGIEPTGSMIAANSRGDGGKKEFVSRVSAA